MKPKFRAWDKRFSEFEEDFFVSEDGKIYKKTKDTSYGFAISRETSDKVILMQSTDIKDKSGKEIFEFDVVTTTRFLGDDDFNDKVYTGVVKRMQGSWMIDTGKKVMSLWSQFPGEENEVLGNMFENPNLVP
jgi:hypothetical protein